MANLVKAFIIVLILILLVPMVWLLLKELFWLFGFSLSGLFVGGDVGWFILFVIFVAIILWLLSCD